MEIVIELPNDYAEQFYKNKCKNKFDSLATNEFGYVLRKAFEDAKPLPENHGRLIDADALVESLDASDREIYCKAVIEEDAPTVIEGSESE